MRPTPDLTQDAPWKRRFRAWTVAGAVVASREPTRGIAITNQTGVYQIYAWDVPSGGLQQLTFKPSGKPTASLSPDGRFIYYLDDEHGNELGHLVRVPFEGGDPVDITPDMPPYALAATAISRDARVLAFTTATRDGFHTYVCPTEDASFGERRLLFHTRRLMRGLNLSNDGAVAVLGLTERSAGTDVDLVAIDTATGERIGELYDADATLAAVRFSRAEGDERLLCSTTLTGNIRPLIWHPRTGERTDFAFDEMGGAVSPTDWSDDARRVLLTQIDQAVQRLAIFDLERGELSTLDHPAGTIASAHFAQGGGEIFAHIQDATTPGRLVALDSTTGRQKRVVLAGEDAPPATPWRSIAYPSTAGAQIQAWLATPEGSPPYPTILHMHGGPDAVQMNMFTPAKQAWLDHGFAVLDINYRGSVTFGREFQQCIRGDLGHWEIDDIAAAHRWLMENGIAQEGQIFLNGASYGGYLTLMAMGKLPGLFAGGMAVVAIADWVLMFEDQAETLRRYQAALFGGTPDELPEEHAASSPISYASNISAPLLVIQGANDTRCPPRQMKVYEEKLHELGKDVRVHWFEAGHGSYATEQNIEHTELMLEFAYRVLQSRAAAVEI